MSDSNACTKPPPGWSCSREQGHEGPCAARAVRPDGEQWESGNDWLEQIEVDALYEVERGCAIAELGSQDALDLARVALTVRKYAIGDNGPCHFCEGDTVRGAHASACVLLLLLD